jgi:bifunctional UDP-N-acetylglucosamine pyrophosphorylase/glucosamine-1-phosphate N-acetyltransferase
LGWAVHTARLAGCGRIVVVVGHGAELVQSTFEAEDIEFAIQSERLGTGHAVLQTRELLEDSSGHVVVLSGDAPLLRPTTVSRLFASAEQGWGSMAVATVERPGSLGRVVMTDDSRLVRVVEAHEASEPELEIRTVNSGHYVLPLPELFDFLSRIGNDNEKGEYYLPEALILAAHEGAKVSCVELEDESEAWGVNDRRELALIDGALNDRIVDQWMLSGVTVVDPRRTRVDATASIGADCVLHPDVSILGDTTIGEDCELHQGAWLKDSVLGDRVVVHPFSVLEDARVSAEASVGPFARLRPGTELGERVKVGNFVEIKKSTLGAGSKASHLAYLGDATLGEDVNVGAGTITCNYDGVEKHRTVIGDRAFIGSDTMLVAPIEIGADATTAAGSAINQKVPNGALAVGRARQRNIEGWADRKKSKTDSRSRD